MTHRVRCTWVDDDPLYRAYHDQEWGVPQHDDRALFELLVLEHFQAGLAWRTILHKREAFRRAFDGFVPERVAAYGQDDVTRLLADAAIVRHRGKIEAAIHNAERFLQTRATDGSFASFLWAFVDGTPRVERRSRAERAPPKTALSDRVSAELKRRGFRFLGSTTVQAYLQATGVVMDHDLECFRHHELAPG
ncbi:MAG: DNA-3-methyladenine glycosylase I [Trueperaceae bacterium]